MLEQNPTTENEEFFQKRLAYANDVLLTAISLLTDDVPTDPITLTIRRNTIGFLGAIAHGILYLREPEAVNSLFAVCELAAGGMSIALGGSPGKSVSGLMASPEAACEVSTAIELIFHQTLASDGMGKYAVDINAHVATHRRTFYTTYAECQTILLIHLPKADADRYRAFDADFSLVPTLDKGCIAPWECVTKSNDRIEVDDLSAGEFASAAMVVMALTQMIYGRASPKFVRSGEAEDSWKVVSTILFPRWVAALDVCLYRDSYPFRAAILRRIGAEVMALAQGTSLSPTRNDVLLVLTNLDTMASLGEIPGIIDRIGVLTNIPDACVSEYLVLARKVADVHNPFACEYGARSHLQPLQWIRHKVDVVPLDRDPFGPEVEAELRALMDTPA